ncbi:MAG: MFS transporter [candidate division NC10 bacterium]|nr:MFS transporter [candidate division NC10 bacterium]
MPAPIESRQIGEVLSPQETVPWYRSATKAQWHILFAAQMGWSLDAMDVLLYIFAITTISKEWGLSPTTAGLLASVTLFSSAFGGALFGIVADYLGRVRALTLTILIYSLFTGLSGLAQNVGQLALFRFLLGLGMGGEWASGEVLVAETWPREHRGKAIGFVQGGWAIGYILAALLAGVILPRFGWRVLFFIGILPALVVFYIRKHVKEPEIWQKTALQRRAGELGREGQRFTLLQLIHHDLVKFTWIAMLLTSLCMMAYWGLFTWIPAFLSSPAESGGAGLTIVKTSLWIIPMQLGALAGYITFGMISDWLGRRPAFALYLLTMGILVPIFGHTRNETVLLLMGPLLGFFGSGYFSGFGALLAELYPTRIRGTAQGFIYNFGRGVSSLAPTLIGMVAKLKGFGFAIGTVSIFTITAALAVLLLPETKAKVLD